MKKCEHYDTYSNGDEFCHNEYVWWWRFDKDNKLECKGNKHICKKLKYKWLASLSEKERKKMLALESVRDEE